MLTILSPLESWNQYTVEIQREVNQGVYEMHLYMDLRISFTYALAMFARSTNERCREHKIGGVLAQMLSSSPDLSNRIEKPFLVRICCIFVSEQDGSRSCF